MIKQNDRSVALQAAEELLDRVCPSAKTKIRNPREVAIGMPDEVVFIPLFIASDAGGVPRLTMHRTSKAISRDNLAALPAGAYRIHVFDTWAEANAASRVAEGLGLLGGTERFRLPGGEGVLLLRAGNGLSSPDEGIFENTPLSLNVKVPDGVASIDIIDERRQYDEDHPCFFMSRQIASSASYPMIEVLRAIHDHASRESNATLRAHVAACLLEQEGFDEVTLREIQHKIEAMPGANVALETVCVEDVLVQIEEISDELEHQVNAPSDETLHEMILEGLRSTRNGEELARRIAYKTFSSNMIHPC